MLDLRSEIFKILVALDEGDVQLTLMQNISILISYEIFLRIHSSN